MKILIVNNSKIPVTLYGGTERVIWDLAHELVKVGHQVSFLVQQGSYCEFAKVYSIDDSKKIEDQIPNGYDIIHFNFRPKSIEKINTPFLVTIHGNQNIQEEHYLNTVFVSENHAKRFGSTSFIHNGLDWDNYSKPNLTASRKYFHFLGNAAWRVKNVQGAIDIIKNTNSEKLYVLGGKRLNISMGFRFTISPRVRFYGMVGGQRKYDLLNGSKGLIFPVKWHEPFGLAIIESLYYGCPVFATPYGSLPELVSQEIGVLSNNENDLTNAIKNSNDFSKKKCHDYAVENFNSKKMTTSYLEKYNKILLNENLNATPPKLIEIQNNKFLDWNKQ